MTLKNAGKISLSSVLILMITAVHHLDAEVKTDVRLDFEESDIISKSYRPTLTLNNFTITTKALLENKTDFSSVYIGNGDHFHSLTNGGHYLRCLSADGGFSIHHEKGYLFQILSIDLAELASSYYEEPITIECVGFLEDGTQIRHSLTTDGINDEDGPKQDFQTFLLPSNFDRLMAFEILSNTFYLDNIELTVYGEPYIKKSSPIPPVYFDVNWDFSEDNKWAETGLGNQITSVNFGLAYVRESYGLLKDRPIELARLNSPNSRYGQVQFDLQRGDDVYAVDFDMYRSDLEEFSVFFNTDAGFFKAILTESLSFYRTHPPEGELKKISIVEFQFDSEHIYHIRIEYNIKNSSYSFYIDSVLISEGTASIGATDVKDVRFNYTDIEGDGGAAIDNVLISGRKAEFEPEAFGSILINPQNNHSYYVLERSDWVSARFTALKLGGDLAVIEDEFEKKWIESVVTDYISGNDAIWVGLLKTTENDEWRWVNHGIPNDFAFTEETSEDDSDEENTPQSAVVGEMDTGNSQLNYFEEGINETHYALVESPISLPHPFPNLIHNKFSTALAIESESGEFIGEGKSYFYTSGNSTFLINLNSDNSISLSITSETIQWLLQFGDHAHELLEKRVYSNALQNPSNSQQNPKLIVMNNMRASSTLNGSFEIKEITYDNNIVTSLWIVFRLRADQNTHELAGELKYNTP